ncbi:hypothetical protein [Azospirillum argentinense]
MRLAIHLPLQSPETGHEVTTARRLEKEARACGWTSRLCRLTRDVEDFAPGAVLAVDPFSAKPSSHPWIGWMNAQPEHLRCDWPRLSCVLSFGGWITALPACADFLDDIFAPTAKRASVAGIGAADGTADALNLLPGFLGRCFGSLVAQAAGLIGLVVVRHALVDGLEEELDRACGDRKIWLFAHYRLHRFVLDQQLWRLSGNHAERFTCSRLHPCRHGHRHSACLRNC